MGDKPTRGYSWPPFTPGHKLSVRHGAYSDQIVLPMARQLIAGLLSDRPDLGAYPEALAAWSDSECRAWLLRSYLDEQGMFEGDEPRATVLKYLAIFDKRASEARARLGLDPVSEANLAKARADASRSIEDIEALRAKGAEIIEARTVAETGEIGDMAG